MFWKKSDSQKLSGPKDIPDFIRIYMAANLKIDAGTIPFLKGLVKNSEKGEDTFDIVIFDPGEAEARGIKTLNYDVLKEHPELVIAQGWYEIKTKKVELELRKEVQCAKLLTYDEVLSQIEGLKDPGASVFFYTSAGSGVGGPLGRGAAIVRLNPPEVNGKKQKKYTVYSTSVVDMQPTKDEFKIFDSDKIKDMAKWVAETQKPRFC